MPITVDDAFLNRASNANQLISEQVTNSPQGDIATITLKSGHSSFSLSAPVQTAVAGVGAALNTRLGEIRTTALNRSTQLTMYAAISDDAEDLNNVSAQSFLTNIPAWNTSPSTGHGS
ncbi:hypothetical protein [Dactylosporangium sp. NPDC005555]|uniref:hypothetical protein n=1 Tax=Dactylosporangium sp. NPDC005555 TaxID=3154889 RepID=UPI0033A56F29